MKTLIAALLVAVTSLPAATGLRAGVARVKITPPLPVWLSGYALRTKPANSVLMDLNAKALALDDGQRGKVVIITTDLIGLPQEVSDGAAALIQKQSGLQRAQIVFNSSHTHTGPIVWPALPVMVSGSPEEQQAQRQYSRDLTARLANVAAEAMRGLASARLSFGSGTAEFSFNRRAPKLREDGKNPLAPVDHSVPVLRVQDDSGKLLAVLFGYACHNTTLTAEFLEVSGDYAGYAQAAIERDHPGATALFLELCGADQNPNPRSKHELAQQYGEALNKAVSQTLAGPMQSVAGRIRTAYQTIDLPFVPKGRQEFELEAKNDDVFRRRRAQLMLKAFDEGRPIRSVRYPVQALRMPGFTLVALGGEVVVDYALRLKREFPKEPLVVAGYSNVVMSYIPSARVWDEGGYEAEDAMIYYGLPGKYTRDVEERIVRAVHKALAATGAKL